MVYIDLTPHFMVYIDLTFDGVTLLIYYCFTHVEEKVVTTQQTIAILLLSYKQIVMVLVDLSLMFTNLC